MSTLECRRVGESILSLILVFSYVCNANSGVCLMLAVKILLIYSDLLWFSLHSIIPINISVIAPYCTEMNISWNQQPLLKSKVKCKHNCFKSVGRRQIVIYCIFVLAFDVLCLPFSKHPACSISSNSIRCFEIIPLDFCHQEFIL